MIFGRVTNPNLHNVYLKNYNEPKAEIFTEISSVCFLFPNLISSPEPSPKKLVAKMPRWLVFCSETLEPSCFDPKCYEPITKIAQKLYTSNRFTKTIWHDISKWEYLLGIYRRPRGMTKGHQPTSLIIVVGLYGAHNNNIGVGWVV